MKLESLKSKGSKFDAFKKDEMLSMINVFGGQPCLTSKTKDGPKTDCWENSTGNDIHCTDGSNYDVCSI